jgi:hypothetical protein
MQRLSGIQGRLSNGVSEWARKWALPDDLMHRYGKKRMMQPVRKTVMTTMQPVRKTVMTISRGTKKTVTQK